MSVSNGTAMPAILRLGDCTPKRLPVEIEREGKTLVLQGYVYGNRCPTVVKSEIASAFDEWVDSTDVTDRDTPPSEWPRADRTKLRAEYQRYVRTCILSLVPGLEFDEADTIASDVDDENGPAKTLLRYLGYFKEEVAESDAPKEEADDDNPPDPSISVHSLPTSLPATESGSTRGSRSRNA